MEYSTKYKKFNRSELTRRSVVAHDIIELQCHIRTLRKQINLMIDQLSEQEIRNERISFDYNELRVRNEKVISDYDNLSVKYMGLVVKHEKLMSEPDLENRELLL